MGTLTACTLVLHKGIALNNVYNIDILYYTDVAVEVGFKWDVSDYITHHRCAHIHVDIRYACTCICICMYCKKKETDKHVMYMTTE